MSPGITCTEETSCLGNRNLLLMGRSQVGKSWLIKSILRYGHEDELADSIISGTHNASVTTKVDTFRAKIELQTHTMTDKTGSKRNVNLDSRDQPHDFWRWDEFTFADRPAGKHLHLCIIDTPGLDDSRNAEAGGAGKTAVSPVDAKHTISILKALNQVDEIHMACLVDSLAETIDNNHYDNLKDCKQILESAGLMGCLTFIHTHATGPRPFTTMSSRVSEVEKQLRMQGRGAPHFAVNSLNKLYEEGGPSPPLPSKTGPPVPSKTSVPKPDPMDMFGSDDESDDDWATLRGSTAVATQDSSDDSDSSDSDEEENTSKSARYLSKLMTSRLLQALSRSKSCQVGSLVFQKKEGHKEMDNELLGLIEREMLKLQGEISEMQERVRGELAWEKAREARKVASSLEQLREKTRERNEWDSEELVQMKSVYEKKEVGFSAATLKIAFQTPCRVRKIKWDKSDTARWVDKDVLVAMFWGVRDIEGEVASTQRFCTIWARCTVWAYKRDFHADIVREKKSEEAQARAEHKAAHQRLAEVEAKIAVEEKKVEMLQARLRHWEWAMRELRKPSVDVSKSARVLGGLEHCFSSSSIVVYSLGYQSRLAIPVDTSHFLNDQLDEFEENYKQMKKFRQAQEADFKRAQRQSKGSAETLRCLKAFQSTILLERLCRPATDLDGPKHAHVGLVARLLGLKGATSEDILRALGSDILEAFNLAEWDVAQMTDFLTPLVDVPTVKRGNEDGSCSLM